VIVASEGAAAEKGTFISTLAGWDGNGGVLPPPVATRFRSGSGGIDHDPSGVGHACMYKLVNEGSSPKEYRKVATGSQDAATCVEGGVVKCIYICGQEYDFILS
jgi:hypothetical protein